MSYSVGQIGYFQLSNLVRNKVPFTFLILNFEPTLEQAPLEFRSLLSLAVRSTTSEAVQAVSQLGLKREHPIVVLCEQGSESLQISKDLESKGFLNIYHVKGGWVNVLTESGVS